MRTKSILLLFSAIFILSCKNDKAEDIKTPAKEVVAETFKVTLDVVVKKDDSFSLFYTEDGTIDFKGDPIWVAVKGSDAEQQVIYTLPADAFPTELRLDFGLNKIQEDIVLQSIVIEYKGNKKEIAGPALANFFRADDSKCTFDATTGIIKALVKDGVRQYPSLYPQEANLKPELEKLAK